MLLTAQLSEEAQESRNKDYKKCCLHHARKCFRIAQTTILLYTLDLRNMRPYNPISKM